MNIIGIMNIRHWSGHHRGDGGVIVIASTGCAAREIGGDSIPSHDILCRGKTIDLGSEPHSIIVADLDDLGGGFKAELADKLRRTGWSRVRCFVFNDYRPGYTSPDATFDEATGASALADLLRPAAHHGTADFKPSEAQAHLHETGKLDLFVGGQEALDAIQAQEKTEGERLYDFFMTSEHDRVRPIQVKVVQPEARPTLPYLMARLADGERLTGLDDREFSDLGSAYHLKGLSRCFRFERDADGSYSAWLVKS